MNKSCHTYECCISHAVDTILCQGCCNPCLKSTHQPSRSVATQYWQQPVTHNCTELHGRRREHYVPSSWPNSTYFQEEIISAGLSLFMCIFVSCYVQNSWVFKSNRACPSISIHTCFLPKNPITPPDDEGGGVLEVEGLAVVTETSRPPPPLNPPAVSTIV